MGGGQISPAVCPEGYDGYSYRICTEGRFGDVQMDKCVQRMPEGVRFPTGRYLFVIDTQVSTGAPRFHNIVEKWSLEEGQKLPAGLTLNVQTGEISGIPTEKASLTTFTVVAENQSGSVTTTVNLEVRKGQCPADGLFPVTEVGVTAEYQCSDAGQLRGHAEACVQAGREGRRVGGNYGRVRLCRDDCFRCDCGDPRGGRGRVHSDKSGTKDEGLGRCEGKEEDNEEGGEG